VAATRVLVLLRQGQAAAAAGLALAHDLPLSQARALVAQGKAGAALAALATRDRQAEAQAWPDEQLRVRVLQALAYQALAETGQALDRLREALALAEPGGFVRLFVDEGAPMGRLLAEAAARGIRPEYVGKLLAAVGAEPQPALAASPAETDRSEASAARTPVPPLIEPLSQRELEVLRLMAQGLSNSEISERLFLALSTVKGHNQRIFDKLHVQRRTEAVARARELGLI
jgi:LuxR family maltose regulon positive regulatory protein